MLKLTRELIRRFEGMLADTCEELMRRSLAVPGNPEGYAFYREGPIRAYCSTNPHARWATSAHGLNQQPADAVKRVLGFFDQHGVAPCVRIIPDGFAPAQAQVLVDAGLRQIGFHTVLFAPLTDQSPADTSVDIREARTPEEIDAHIRIQLAGFGVPEEAIRKLLPLRRTWWGAPQLKFYLAYVDGVPAAQAILKLQDDLGYLASASTLPDYRGRGLQTQLIKRRLHDAATLGCQIAVGAADFESSSRTNQMTCGLQIAYTAALWTKG